MAYLGLHVKLCFGKKSRQPSCHLAEIPKCIIKTLALRSENPLRPAAPPSCPFIQFPQRKDAEKYEPRMVVPCFCCPAISSCSTVLSFLEGNSYNPVCMYNIYIYLHIYIYIYIYNKDMESSPVIWVACVEFTGTPVLMGAPFPYSHRKPQKTSGKIMGINVPSARGPKKNPWINRRVKCNNQVNTWAKNSMDYMWSGWRKNDGLVIAQA